MNYAGFIIEISATVLSALSVCFILINLLLVFNQLTDKQ